MERKAITLGYNWPCDLENFIYNEELFLIFKKYIKETGALNISFWLNNLLLLFFNSLLLFIYVFLFWQCDYTDSYVFNICCQYSYNSVIFNEQEIYWIKIDKNVQYLQHETSSYKLKLELDLIWNTVSSSILQLYKRTVQGYYTFILFCLPHYLSNFMLIKYILYDVLYFIVIRQIGQKNCVGLYTSISNLLIFICVLMIFVSYYIGFHHSNLYQRNVNSKCICSILIYQPRIVKNIYRAISYVLFLLSICQIVQKTVQAL